MSTILDNYLQMAYKSVTNGAAPPVNEFRDAVKKDSILNKASMDRLSELNTLINSRGEKACYVSTVYRNFLREAINAT